ncbi:MAG: MBL fold metallo-hydrolase [Candidatus Hydrogenedentes bacterium]|nr:MBL fold metallo-hydrolase [Candidatus Hydrogenedentota bacterium]
MLKEVNITLLVDNLAREGLAVEHGFAVLVEAGGRRILFDTGQTGAVLGANADALGADLSGVEAVVLSHGHYDHTGGVPLALARAPRAAVWCHPGVFVPRWSLRDGQPREIGMPPAAREALTALPAGQLRRVTAPVLATPGVWITGPVPRGNPYEDTGGPFFLDPEGTKPDLLPDDLSLWMETPEGVVVLTGCCHAGLMNTLMLTRNRTGGRPLRALIGGFHLVNAGEQRMARTLETLRTLNPAAIVPCHCTGEAAVQVLQEAFGEKATPGAAGMTLRF